jgi:hypothetical protein
VQALLQRGDDLFRAAGVVHHRGGGRTGGGDLVVDGVGGLPDIGDLLGDQPQLLGDHRGRLVDDRLGAIAQSHLGLPLLQEAETQLLVAYPLGLFDPGLLDHQPGPGGVQDLAQVTQLVPADRQRPDREIPLGHRGHPGHGEGDVVLGAPEHPGREPGREQEAADHRRRHGYPAR